MCGFAGVFANPDSLDGTAEAAAARMASTLVHRGPDDDGSWMNPAGTVGLGFRRLSIIDLSPLGHQPMTSAAERFSMVFNGEIYNHRRLRDELEGKGHRFRGHSDTEVILAAFEEWGIEATIPRLWGMFAVAVWDAEADRLVLARDRLGIKPLYVYSRAGVTAFGSELKALMALPAVDRSVDPASVEELLRYLYIPAPNTIYRHVRKMLPGTILSLGRPGDERHEEAFWRAEDAYSDGLQRRFEGSETEASDELERLLRSAVESRMYADVPLGAFLSGGIDSSTVVALMQDASEKPVRTFSVAFDATEFNEAHEAARVAKHLGTEHTELLCSGDEALQVVPKLADIFDEPHADTAQVPTWLMCSKARGHVTVALSGDGGDEVFGGYNRYSHGKRLIQRMHAMPGVLRSAGRAAVLGVSPNAWDSLHRAATPFTSERQATKHFGQKLHKLGRLMGEGSDAAMYRSLVSVWPDAHELVRHDERREDLLDDTFEAYASGGLIDRMMLADQRMYLPDDQLTKVDRVSMSVGLEVRVPLLDHRLVEFAWTLPEEMRTSGGVGKRVLRNVLHRRVPRELVERPKMGFSVPVGQWLRGALRPWAEELLSRNALVDGNILEPEPILQSWSQLQSGRDESALGLWAVLMFQSWKERWIDG